MSKKIKYRDYREYPPEFSAATRWRDTNVTANNVAFILLAERHNMLARLVELGRWEESHTDVIK